MAMTGGFRLAGWTVVVFLALLVLDIAGYYRMQLVSAATTPGAASPRLPSKPAIRHAVLFLLAWLVASFHADLIRGLSTGVVSACVLFVAYWPLLFWDSLRDLKRRSRREAAESTAGGSR